MIHPEYFQLMTIRMFGTNWQFRISDNVREMVQNLDLYSGECGIERVIIVNFADFCVLLKGLELLHFIGVIFC